MKPTAAKGTFPYRHHRTMEQVMRDEAYDDWQRRPKAYEHVTLEQWRRTARG